MSGWDGLLNEGETLLWQGRPEVGFDWTMLLTKETPKGLFIVLFALIWIGIALQVTGDNEAPFLMRILFPLIALPILLGGLRQAFGPALERYYRLRTTTYSLTSEAAYIAIERGGKRQLERLSLRDGQLSPTLEDGSPGSIWLITRPRPSGSWSILSGGSPNETAGFELIPEARQVYRLLIDTIASRPPAPLV